MHTYKPKNSRVSMIKVSTEMLCRQNYMGYKATSLAVVVAWRNSLNDVCRGGRTRRPHRVAPPSHRGGREVLVVFLAWKVPMRDSQGT